MVISGTTSILMLDKITFSCQILELKFGNRCFVIPSGEYKWTKNSLATIPYEHIVINNVPIEGYPYIGYEDTDNTIYNKPCGVVGFLNNFDGKISNSKEVFEDLISKLPNSGKIIIN